MAILAICAALIVALVLSASGVRLVFSFLWGCLVVPTFVVFAEFGLPYSGGGASMWPVALLFGGAYGAAASAIGTISGQLLRKNRGAN